MELRALPKQNFNSITIPEPPSNCITIKTIPKWFEYPFNMKFPMFKSPEPIIFTRAKLGCQLWQTKQSKDFDLHSNNIRIEYSPLHDPHLKSHFLKDSNLKLLRKIGKITDENDVSCSLREFNEFRNLLYKYYTEGMQKKSHKDNLAKQKSLQHHHSTDYAIRYEMTKFRRLKNDSMKRDKFKKICEKVQNIMQRTETIKELKRIVLKEKNQLRDVAIRERRLLAKELRKRKILEIKRKLKEDEIKRDKIREHMKLQKEMKSKRKANELWKRMVKSHDENRQRCLELLKKADKVKNKNIEKRMKMYQPKKLKKQKQHKPKTEVKPETEKSHSECEWLQKDEIEDKSSEKSTHDFRFLEKHLYKQISTIMEDIQDAFIEKICNMININQSQDNQSMENTSQNTLVSKSSQNSSSHEKVKQESSKKQQEEKKEIISLHLEDFLKNPEMEFIEKYVRKFEHKLKRYVQMHICSIYEDLKIHLFPPYNYELLELDNDYLIQTIAASILNKDDMNFESYLILCGNYCFEKVLNIIKILDSMVIIGDLYDDD